MIKLIATVLLGLLRSWEFIAAVVFFIIAFPLIFYIASFKPQQKRELMTERVKKAKKKVNKNKEEGSYGEADPEHDI